jgi:hypothetical protein
MGLDCAEGSIEYYDNVIQRNKLIREVIREGHSLIDPEGNFLKQVIRIPFTDRFFYINSYGLKLTERKENCKKELHNMIYKLLKENDETKKKQEQSETLQEEGEEKINQNDNSKEWKIFRDLRLKLEDAKHGGSSKKN